MTKNYLDTQIQNIGKWSTDNIDFIIIIEYILFGYRQQVGGIVVKIQFVNFRLLQLYNVE